MSGGYPSTRVLANRLGAMLDADGTARGDVEIVGRSPEPSSSTFPSEIVTCRISGRGALTLLCKYSRPQRCTLPAWHGAHGHRHGIGYEGRVYRHVLEPLQMTTPRLWGTYETKGGRAWLAVEYLDQSMRINSAPPGLAGAAAWIGRFHACNETRVSDPAVRFLNTYTADYYRGWARRTLKSARRFRRECRQIEALCGVFEEAIDVLLEPPLTIIHGEYYPANVLWRSETVYPVDWESAAIAAGEIDLACLTEHWSPEIVASCRAAYVRARWPGGCDQAVFAGRLWAARLYVALRWAGTPGALTAREDRAYYLNRIGGELDRISVRGAVEPTPVAAR